MFIEAHKLQEGENFSFDICVIGGGVAGITFAREFVGTRAKVCVLESGGLSYHSDPQSLCDGEVVGLDYYSLLSTRLRYFGGSSNHWGGNCHPFSRITFQKRSWIPGSGWPITWGELENYRERASTLLDLPENSWDHDYWVSKFNEPPLKWKTSRFDPIVVQVAPVRFGTKFREELNSTDNISIYLNANVTGIESSSDLKSISHVNVATLSRSNFRIQAKVFVLAAGGLENPRLLLLSDKHQPEGVGNKNGLVGRFFMDQPRFVGAKMYPTNSRLPMSLYSKINRIEQAKIAIQFQLSHKILEEESLTQVTISPVAIPTDSYRERTNSKGVRSLKKVNKNLKNGELDDLGKHMRNIFSDFDYVTEHLLDKIGDESFSIKHIDCWVRIEPTPNMDSRVLLADTKDNLGLRKIKLDWQLNEDDKRTVKRAVEIFSSDVAHSGLGRVKSLVHQEDWNWPNGTFGGHHHIGTTRMGDDKNQSVVDRNCRVHDLENLYIAGSSVFPTADSDWPTFMILTLTMRLADHIKKTYRGIA